MSQDTGSVLTRTPEGDPDAAHPTQQPSPPPPPKPARTGGSIFISYASGDVATAREVRRHLEDGGYSCWMAPDSVRGPKPWAEQIVDAIHACQAMVVLMSSRSNASTHVSKELQLASEEAKPLLPIRVEDVNPSGSMQYLLALAQWVDAFPGPIADHAAVLREGVAAIFASAGIEAPEATTTDMSAPVGYFCSSCGAQAGDDERFCSHCGHPLGIETSSAAEPPVAQNLRKEPLTIGSILSGGSGRGLQIGAVVGALAVIAALIFGITALGGDDTAGDETAAGSTPETAAQPATTTPTTAPGTTTLPTTSVTTAPVVPPVSIVPTDVGPDTFVDDFDGSLETGWEWFSEQPSNWSLSAAPGMLRIRATDTFPPENLLVRPASSEAFEATTVVRFTPSMNYQVAGLIVMTGPFDFVQLGRGFCDHCVGDGIYMDLVLDGAVSEALWLGIEPSEVVHLRIESDGDSYAGFYSPDGISWQAVGTHTAAFSAPLVGLVAHQSPIAAAAEFEYFTLTPFGDPITEPHMVSVFDLEEGACFDDPDDFSSVGELAMIECSQPHDNEIYAVFDYVGGDAFPGSSAMESFVQEECIDRFETFVGIDYFDSEIWYSAFWPSAGSWEAGDREIICFLYEGDLSKITGSLQGAAR